MNIELFTAFLLITIVLIITPGPIVTHIISTVCRSAGRADCGRGRDARQRPALGGDRLRARLGPCARRSPVEALRWTGAAYLVWLGVQAWRHAGEGEARLMETGRTRFARGIAGRPLQSENDRVLHRLPAAVPRSQAAGGAAARGYVRRHRCSRRRLRLRLGDRRRPGPRVVHEARPGETAGRLSGTVLIGGGLWLSLARRSS